MGSGSAPSKYSAASLSFGNRQNASGTALVAATRPARAVENQESEREKPISCESSSESRRSVRSQLKPLLSRAQSEIHCSPIACPAAYAESSAARCLLACWAELLRSKSCTALPGSSACTLLRSTLVRAAAIKNAPCCSISSACVAQISRAPTGGPACQSSHASAPGLGFALGTSRKRP